MNLPVKRVENRTENHTREQKYETAGREQKYGNGGSASIRNSGEDYENHTAKQTARTPLPLAVTFPLSGRFRDLHPLEHVRAGRTPKKG